MPKTASEDKILVSLQLELEKLKREKIELNNRRYKYIERETGINLENKEEIDDLRDETDENRIARSQIRAASKKFYHDNFEKFEDINEQFKEIESKIAEKIREIELIEKEERDNAEKQKLINEFNDKVKEIAEIENKIKRLTKIKEEYESNGVDDDTIKEIEDLIKELAIEMSNFEKELDNIKTKLINHNISFKIDNERKGCFGCDHGGF